MIDEPYDPGERTRQKQAARAQDQADLESGRISKEDLAARNGFFAGMDVAGSKVIRRKRQR